jgi:hypothetical protein
MMVVREACPACESQQFKKNGHIHNGKQNHQSMQDLWSPVCASRDAAPRAGRTVPWWNACYARKSPSTGFAVWWV